MMADSNSSVSPALQSCVQSLKLGQIQRHIFICADQTLPKCCDKEKSLVAWNYLKQRIRELKLDTPSEDTPSENISQATELLEAGELVDELSVQMPPYVFRTKANCLRVCQQGPILVVYPEGVWYHSATPEVIEKILQNHILKNQIVAEYAFLVHALPNQQINQGEARSE